jgi:hypothetical protein
VLDSWHVADGRRGREPERPRGRYRAARALRSHFLSRAEVLRILRDPASTDPTRADYRGDLQMHSEWSDGTPSLDEIADACLARGYAHAAVTDHSHGSRLPAACPQPKPRRNARRSRA